jgi:hypothetical protein
MSHSSPGFFMGDGATAIQIGKSLIDHLQKAKLFDRIIKRGIVGKLRDCIEHVLFG